MGRRNRLEDRRRGRLLVYPSRRETDECECLWSLRAVYKGERLALGGVLCRARRWMGSPDLALVAVDEENRLPRMLERYSVIYLNAWSHGLEDLHGLYIQNPLS